MASISCDVIAMEAISRDSEKPELVLSWELYADDVVVIAETAGIILGRTGVWTTTFYSGPITLGLGVSGQKFCLKMSNAEIQSTN